MPTATLLEAHHRRTVSRSRPYQGSVQYMECVWSMNVMLTSGSGVYKSSEPSAQLTIGMLRTPSLEIAFSTHSVSGSGDAAVFGVPKVSGRRGRSQVRRGELQRAVADIYARAAPCLKRTTTSQMIKHDTPPAYSVSRPHSADASLQRRLRPRPRREAPWPDARRLPRRGRARPPHPPGRGEHHPQRPRVPARPRSVSPPLITLTPASRSTGRRSAARAGTSSAPRGAGARYLIYMHLTPRRINVLSGGTSPAPGRCSHMTSARQTTEPLSHPPTLL